MFHSKWYILKYVGRTEKTHPPFNDFTKQKNIELVTYQCPLCKYYMHLSICTLVNHEVTPYGFEAGTGVCSEPEREICSIFVIIILYALEACLGQVI